MHSSRSPLHLHLWWARRPLAAARAVIFAQMVNDPGYQQGDGFKYGVNKQEAGDCSPPQAARLPTS
ncbi:MAG: DUF1156 domain-containing protein [Aeromonas sp.]